VLYGEPQIKTIRLSNSTRSYDVPLTWDIFQPSSLFSTNYSVNFQTTVFYSKGFESWLLGLYLINLNPYRSTIAPKIEYPNKTLPKLCVLCFDYASSNIVMVNEFWGTLYLIYILCEFYKRMQLYCGGTKHGRQPGNEWELLCRRCKNVMERERECWEED
jgi:RNA polymerase subunit RPABC4/transcription elongation factor Spt4